MPNSWIKNYDLISLDTIDSTNSEALRLASAHIPNNTVITTKYQTGGRGSKGRSWVSIPGNLHMSILLDITQHIQRNFELVFLTGNVLANVITKLATKQKVKAQSSLKWPNDVLLNSKKVAGILVETINFGQQFYTAIGIGLNILSNPSAGRYPATSLREERIKVRDQMTMLNLIMGEFNREYIAWQQQDFAKIREVWLQRAHNLNQPINVEIGTDNIQGIFETITGQGELALKLADGSIKYINNAENIL